METSEISREQAAAALATIEASRGLVQAEQARRRGRRHVQRTLLALSPLVEYAPRDLVRSRFTRWALLVGWRVALFAVGREIGMPIISRMPRFRPESGKRSGLVTVVLITGLAVTERVAVLLLRRSRLRWPNVVAGFVAVGLRTGFRFLLGRLFSGDPPSGETTGQLHRALLLPDSLRVAALLGDGELIDLEFVRDAFGIDRLDLAEDLQPLFEAKLAASLLGSDGAKVFLTPDGRDAYAGHVEALRRLSTGDTPR